MDESASYLAALSGSSEAPLGCQPGQRPAVLIEPDGFINLLSREPTLAAFDAVATKYSPYNPTVEAELSAQLTDRRPGFIAADQILL